MTFNKRGLTDLGYKIFLDRYAVKGLRTKAVGTYVLALKDGVKELCQICKNSTTSNLVDVQLVERISDEDNLPIFSNIVWELDYNSLDFPIEFDPVAMWDRVATAVASVTAEHRRGLVVEAYKALLADWKFIPGGRILAAAGADTALSFYNCFVIPSPEDSKTGIFDTANDMAHIMSRGGGVGINISTLRPRYAYTQSTNGRSSGAVSWGEIYSVVTGMIEQGGSRRGALMLILEDWHPDIEEFISVKKDAKRITNANISVGISDAFMEAVDADADWELVFPDTAVPDYTLIWNGNLKEWRQNGYPVIIHKVVKARALWQSIIEAAWASAEPGLWFKDRANAMSNSWYYAPLVCTNPCGEQSLPDWGICNLGSINLAQFVTPAGTVMWNSLAKSVQDAVMFLDGVIDLTPYFHEENARQQLSERRVGLGTMGLAEMLLKLKIAYGSDECIVFLDRLYKFIAEAAYGMSIDLADLLGSFPEFNANYVNSGFIKQLPEHYAAQIMQKGIRNVTLLTQAPTGTTGTMVNTSTGIEPYFYWEWTRKGRMGESVERVRLYDEWVKNNPGQPLPAWFVTAQDLTPEQHVRVQAAIQKWVDSSISKTCNVPNDYTIDQVGALYRLMYELGCKGGTVYRDGSRDTQVLNIAKSAGKAVNAPTRHRPETLSGQTYRKQTPAGTLYVTINYRADGPFEVFLTVGKAGSEITAQAEALGRLISYILRLPSPDSPADRLQMVIGQLRDIGSGRAMGFGPHRVASLPDGVAQCLEMYAQEEGFLPKVAHLPEGKENGIVHIAGDLCPTCGNASFIRMEGCKKCVDCGYSEC